MFWVYIVAAAYFIYARYRQLNFHLDYCSAHSDKWTPRCHLLNSICAILGSVSVAGLVVLASFQVSVLQSRLIVSRRAGRRHADVLWCIGQELVLCAQACSFFAVHILGATTCFASAALYALVQCALTQLVHHSAALNPHMRRARAPLVADGTPVPPAPALPPLHVAINGARTQHYGAVSVPPLQPSRERLALANAVLESDSPSASVSVSASSAHRDALCSLHTSRGARLLHALRCLLVLLLLLLVPLGASLVPSYSLTDLNAYSFYDVWVILKSSDVHYLREHRCRNRCRNRNS